MDSCVKRRDRKSENQFDLEIVEYRLNRRQGLPY